MRKPVYKDKLILEQAHLAYIAINVLSAAMERTD